MRCFDLLYTPAFLAYTGAMENTQPVDQPAKKQPSDPQATLTAGSLVAGIATPLYKIFKAAECFIAAADGISVDELGAQVVITTIEARELIRIFHVAVGLRPGERLGGTVQIDEGVLVLDTVKDGGNPQIRIAIAVENKSESVGRIALGISDDASERPWRVFMDMIQHGATIETHRPEVYGFGLEQNGRKVTAIINHTGGTARPHLPLCAQVFDYVHKILKNKYRGEISRNNLQGYLDEISFRWNYRGSLRSAETELKDRLGNPPYQKQGLYKDKPDGWDNPALP